ncbi:MAG: type IV pilin protein [Magnetococcales bacterium]|nr:type IV pilin protein [Magnetococcales bacterium]
MANRLRTRGKYGATEGFSLIELLIAMAIIGVLAAIAVPQYQDSARKTRRADAHAALLQVASRMERYYYANNSYANATLGSGGVYNSSTSEKGYYNLTLNGTSAAFTVTASVNATGAQASDASTCGNLTLNSDGGKAPTACW